MTVDYKDATKKILAEVRSIVLLDDISTAHPYTVDQEVIRLLAMAWADAVRAQWQAYVDADPELKAQHAVAKELMVEDGYLMDSDPICGLPGVKPYVAIVDGKESVCFDQSMPQVTPLSAIYTNKVRIVQSAAARAAKKLAEEAVKTPWEWPITIASGETFNSIDEMEKSAIHTVREMAQMMRDAEHYGQQSDSAPLPGLIKPRVVQAGMLTCWQYFGFEGPTSFENLQVRYRQTIGEITLTGTGGPNRLAAEAHKQYQNCLKELGAAILYGTPDTGMIDKG